ncbi:helix-turn-helix domain-containing protein [Catenulispora subtropica]|uniref:Winged helix-turn-helix domain-containing protein n=1 Tax=Catenulispora subtropica TaxID=450798 RepID=A0ABN2S7M7_9ACTN
MSQTPPEPIGDANGDRSAIFRTLTHPLRRRMLAYLQQHREANSTSLAKALGESTGTTSYHLRKLAELRFVEEIPERSTGRERWWRALPVQLETPDPATMDPAEFAALAEHVRERAGEDIDLYYRALTQYEGPDGWAQSFRGGFFMSKEELQGFVREYNELQWKYGHVDPREAPDGARRMALRMFVVPAPPQDEADAPAE